MTSVTCPLQEYPVAWLSCLYLARAGLALHRTAVVVIVGAPIKEQILTPFGSSIPEPRDRAHESLLMLAHPLVEIREGKLEMLSDRTSVYPRRAIDNGHAIDADHASSDICS